VTTENTDDSIETSASTIVPPEPPPPPDPRIPTAAKVVATWVVEGTKMTTRWRAVFCPAAPGDESAFMIEQRQKDAVGDWCWAYRYQVRSSSEADTYRALLALAFGDVVEGTRAL